MRNDTVRVVILGDVMMHSRQLAYDHSRFLSAIEPALKKADIAIAGAEFTTSGEPYTGYPRFSAPDSYVQSLRDSGIDVFLCANNHILDYGSKGFRRTLDVIGSGFTGAGRDSAEFAQLNPLILHCKGMRIAFVNCTYGTNCPPDSPWPMVNGNNRKLVGEQMRRARERGADFVVALPHWGNEYELHHSPAQEQWAGFFAANGADVVVGSHPHVVQDTVHVAGVPVIYSMGNAVSNMSARNTRLELMVTLTFVHNRIRGKVGMEEPRLDFLWCTLPGTLTGTYLTIPVSGYLGRRDLWTSPYDYDNMVATLERVKAATNIKAR